MGGKAYFGASYWGPSYFGNDVAGVVPPVYGDPQFHRVVTARPSRIGVAPDLDSAGRIGAATPAGAAARVGMTPDHDDAERIGATPCGAARRIGRTLQ